MNRGQLEDLVDKWHDSESSLSLHEFLGMTEEEYSVWVEFDILPNEQIPRDKFLALRKDAYRWADDADRYKETNDRYREAVSELRAVAEDDWITDILDRNNV
ncbi:hypothetical protein SEA_LILMARTIN_31 [Streptomyces phage LilMartin]|nr:hypothetical protein SEA_LILMARTIN_31 [Streptomyces phage LilMartin]QNO12456.1 hypothetical protein SEA_MULCHMANSION_31 [Streptomyces phage MulchMansion]UVK61129.1 hypothetical protein SEA_ANGELA_31 [Streptomyces phage Angela]